MLSVLVSGGLLLIPILLLSLAAVALIIERGRCLFRVRVRRKDLLDRTMELLGTRGGPAARAELEGDRSPEAAVLRAGLVSGRASASEREARMEAEAKRRMEEMERRVGFLSSIANLATLLGLLGTVTGMIASFLNMRSTGVSDPAVLAGGISQALVTTAAGLSVAIPSLFSYYLFSQIIGRSATRMEMAAAELKLYFGSASARRKE